MNYISTTTTTNTTAAITTVRYGFCHYTEVLVTDRVLHEKQEL